MKKLNRDFCTKGKEYLLQHLVESNKAYIFLLALANTCHPSLAIKALLISWKSRKPNPPRFLGQHNDEKLCKNNFCPDKHDLPHKKSLTSASSREQRDFGRQKEDMM